MFIICILCSRLEKKLRIFCNSVSFQRQKNINTKVGGAFSRPENLCGHKEQIQDFLLPASSCHWWPTALGNGKDVCCTPFQSTWICWLPEIGYPQIIHFSRISHYKSTILGYLQFRCWLRRRSREHLPVWVHVNPKSADWHFTWRKQFDHGEASKPRRHTMPCPQLQLTLYRIYQNILGFSLYLFLSPDHLRNLQYVGFTPISLQNCCFPAE